MEWRQEPSTGWKLKRHAVYRQLGMPRVNRYRPIETVICYNKVGYDDLMKHKYVLIVSMGAV